MTRRYESSLRWFAVASLLVSACGGSAPQPEPAQSGTSPAAGQAEPQEPVSVESAPSVPADPCSSGDCSACGDAVCLRGFYCDEKAAACAWLPQCAKTPGCDCLLEALGGDCTCQERAGAAFVECR